MLLRSGKSGRALGAASYRCLDSQHLFTRLASPELTAFVRQNAGGRTLLISGLFVPHGEQQEDLCQLLLTEVLTLAIGREYTYAVYLPLEGAGGAAARQTMLLQGFLPVSAVEGAMAADMRRRSYSAATSTRLSRRRFRPRRACSRPSLRRTGGCRRR